jgi:multidrug efflux system membrane fusion protein
MKKKVIIPAALMIVALAASGFLYFTHPDPVEATATPVGPSAVPVVAGLVAPA